MACDVLQFVRLLSSFAQEKMYRFGLMFKRERERKNIEDDLKIMQMYEKC